jgi:hypothetical protein
MAKQPVAHKQSRSKRDKLQEADLGTGKNGREDETARYEQELAGYLQERIKPGLNTGAIPLLARSIAKDIAQREHPSDASEDARLEDERNAEGDDEPNAEADDEPNAEADDEPNAEGDDEPNAEADDEPNAEADDESDALLDFEAEMQELQAELGEDWILRFSVQGDNTWLTAEKDDGSQRVEAPVASVLSQAVKLLNERGGRST